MTSYPGTFSFFSGTGNPLCADDLEESFWQENNNCSKISREIRVCREGIDIFGYDLPKIGKKAGWNKLFRGFF
jgi:hypothetical protein